jgi:hypothetical protein
VAPVSEPVQQGAGEPLGAKDFRPFLEGQVRGQHKAVMLIGPADDLEEQFGSCLGEGNISQFIKKEEILNPWRKRKLKEKQYLNRAQDPAKKP